MTFKVERKVLSGFAFHPMNTFEKWEEIGESNSLADALKMATEKDTRVRNFYTGKIY